MRDTDRLSRAIILIRLMVGAVFVSEGVQKFLLADQLGAGRFAKIGLPAPDVLAPFVGSVEMLCGALILLGLFTRWAAVPLMIVILVAIGTTKIPILQESGFWKMAHEARTDYAMLLGSLFLCWTGGGSWALDVPVRKMPKS